MIYKEWDEELLIYKLLSRDGKEVEKIFHEVTLSPNDLKNSASYEFRLSQESEWMYLSWLLIFMDF